MGTITVEYLQQAPHSQHAPSLDQGEIPRPNVLTKTFESVEAALDASLPQRCSYAVFNDGSERYIFTTARGWQKIPHIHRSRPGPCILP